MTMRELTYQVSFNTPAFLGNAEQQAQWRTPPFKALLRQWWRVAYAASKNFRVDVATMRNEEGRLFGHAWLENDRDTLGENVAARKSLLRLRLGQWSVGKLKSWDGLEQQKVDHPEAEKSGYKVGPHAYLAYGPLDGRGGTKFSRKDNAAIQVGEQTTFSLAFPSEYAAHIEQALKLMDRFGSVGGRSRNGWGSITLSTEYVNLSLDNAIPLRDWKTCIQLDWPHAVGQDNQGPLIWQTQPHADWKALMRDLAIVKIQLRREFLFPNAQPDGQIHARHWLSYPVTTHKVNDWNRNNARLPNSLRFKVRPTPDGKLIGVIFHMPCLPPPAFNPDRAAIERVWQQVHTSLDGQAALTRSKG
jgi:CRISPR-associated protein Cmr1